MMSNQNFVQWYADRTHGQLPEVTVWSAPIWLYKGLMLLWALWLAASLIHWLRFGWVALRKGGGYRPNPNRRSRPRTRGIRGTPGPTPPPEGPAGSADTERAGIS